jgi:hypothetical protein
LKFFAELNNTPCEFNLGTLLSWQQIGDISDPNPIIFNMKNFTSLARHINGCPPIPRDSTIQGEAGLFFINGCDGGLQGIHEEVNTVRATLSYVMKDQIG